MGVVVGDMDVMVWLLVEVVEWLEFLVGVVDQWVVLVEDVDLQVVLMLDQLIEEVV